MGLKEKIRDLSQEYHQDVVSIRRFLHKNPELSFHEYETSKFIQNKLYEYGISFKSGIANTGVVALIEGKNPQSKCIALRADIDALPIQELNNVDYCSVNKGVMHACGHDVHTASLLGVARVLNKLKEEWEGRVKLIFQPAEEKFPGGASQMISEGVLENPEVDKIIGQHVSPELQSGTIGMCSGMFMASADEIYITVIGRGGHAALPDCTLNPVLMSSKIICALYEHFDAIEDMPSVLSIGAVDGGSAGNIVPDEVSLQGTFRAMNEEYRSKAHQKIREICQNIANEMGGICEVDIKIGYPFLKNDEKLTSICFKNAQEFLSFNEVIEISKRMTAEDFAYYTHHVPACFYRLGVGFAGEEDRYLHNAHFDIDENALQLSVGMMAWLAVNA
ncbi:MAG: N-acyl-L-amino acid amidohydrolase [Flavobacteriales bacterium]|nr:N-acyl-L-amino acid amidohydrolase [Flavobacteriales bacterium]|tara:strand:- start:443 stop:1615 length:1173 start_codon:yes stop_codon:yes gene_type:complete